jgi:hypothetical protein
MKPVLLTVDDDSQNICSQKDKSIIISNFKLISNNIKFLKILLF